MCNVKTDGCNPVLVIGIGNEYRGDDAVGIHLARRVRDEWGSAAHVVEAGGEGSRLMDLWAGRERVLVFDAIRSGSAAGRVHRLDAVSEAVPQDFFHYSSHAFGLAEAVEMSRILGGLPAQLLIYGVEARCFDAGAPMSTEVAAAVEGVLQLVAGELGIPPRKQPAPIG